MRTHGSAGHRFATTQITPVIGDDPNSSSCVCAREIERVLEVVLENGMYYCVHNVAGRALSLECGHGDDGDRQWPWPTNLSYHCLFGFSCVCVCVCSLLVCVSVCDAMRCLAHTMYAECTVFICVGSKSMSVYTLLGARKWRDWK